MIEVGQSIILTGDVLEMLPMLPEQSVQTCVTSPPYFGLRDYGVDGQIGLEQTPQEYVDKLVQVFRHVRTALRDDGTVWLNLGDSYNNRAKVRDTSHQPALNNFKDDTWAERAAHGGVRMSINDGVIKEKDLVGIPWRVAFALQADGWYLRQDIIWAKPNPMPESVRDRCTKSHEYIFMLTKSPKYYYDADAIKNPPSEALLKQVAEGYNGMDTKDFAASGAQSASGTKVRIIESARKKVDKQRGHSRRHDGFNDRWDAMTKAEQQALGSNKRSVWWVAPKPFKEAHFATFPPDLIEPCILAGSRPGDVVLDPFGGSGTVGLVSNRHGRQSVLIELNPKYVEIAKARLEKDLCDTVGTMTDNLHSKVA